MWLSLVLVFVTISISLRLHQRGQNRRWDLRHHKGADHDNALTGFLDDTPGNGYTPIENRPTALEPPFLKQMWRLYQRAPDAPGTQAFLKQRLNADDPESRLLAALCLGWEAIDVVEWEITIDRGALTREHLTILWHHISHADRAEQRSTWLHILVLWLEGVSYYDPRTDLIREVMGYFCLSTSPKELQEETQHELEDALIRLLRYEGCLHVQREDKRPTKYPNDCIRAPAAKALGIFGTQRSLRALRRYATRWETGKEGKAAARKSIAKIENREPQHGGELSLARQKAACSKGGLSVTCRKSG